MKRIAYALNGYTTSYDVNVVNQIDPLEQLTSTHCVISTKISRLLTQLRGLKFQETITVLLEKDNLVERIYFNSHIKEVTNENDIVEGVVNIVNEIMNGVETWISEGSGWTIVKVIKHYLNVVKYQPLKASSYIPLPKELQSPKKV